MGFWKKISDFLFGELIIIQDDVFGEMIDMGAAFECQKLFLATGKKILLHVEKVDGHVSEKQKNFVSSLDKNYDQFILKIKPILEKKIKEWIANFHIQNFKNEFILEFLSLPKMEDELFEWEIAFYADNDLQHSCLLTIKGNQVINIHIDG